MSTCEKCWDDAGGDPDEYRALVVSRQDNPCTPEEQAGKFAEKCPRCERMTIHQWTKKCTDRKCRITITTPGQSLGGGDE